MNIYNFWSTEAMKIVEGMVVTDVVPSFVKLKTRACNRLDNKNSKLLTDKQTKEWKEVLNSCMQELAQYSASRGFEWSREYIFYHSGFDAEDFMDIITDLSKHDIYYARSTKRKDINLKLLKVSLNLLENRISELRMMSRNEVVTGDMDSEYRVIMEIMIGILGFTSVLGILNPK